MENVVSHVYGEARAARQSRRVPKAASNLGGPGRRLSADSVTIRHPRLSSTSHKHVFCLYYIHEELYKYEVFLKTDNTNSPRAHLHAALSYRLLLTPPIQVIRYYLNNLVNAVGSFPQQSRTGKCLTYIGHPNKRIVQQRLLP